jgi:hypothetical protein
VGVYVGNHPAPNTRDSSLSLISFHILFPQKGDGDQVLKGAQNKHPHNIQMYSYPAIVQPDGGTVPEAMLCYKEPLKTSANTNLRSLMAASIKIFANLDSPNKRDRSQHRQGLVLSQKITISLIAKVNL